MTINTIGQGTVSNRSSRRQDSSQQYSYTNEVDWLTIDLLATPAAGWRFSEWRWSYDYVLTRYQRASESDPWGETSSTTTTYANTATINPLDGWYYNGQHFSYASTDISQDFGLVNPTLAPLEGVYDHYIRYQFPNGPLVDWRHHVWKNLVVTAVFTPGDGPILRSDAGAILRSDAGIILRQG